VEDAGFDSGRPQRAARLARSRVRDRSGAWTAALSMRAPVCVRQAPTCFDHRGIQVFPNLMYATAHYRNGVLLAP